MEENKVKEKLMAILRTDCGQADCKDHSGEWLADQILRSPELRVTLVEKPQTFRAFRHTDKLWEVQESRSGWWVAICTYEESCCAESAAKDYAAYLNSKEPK